MGETEGSQPQPTPEKKLEITRLFLEGLVILAGGVNTTLKQGRVVTRIARALTEPTYTGVSEQGRLEAKSPFVIAIKDEVNKAALNQVTGLANEIVKSELEKLSIDSIEDTRKRIISLTEKFHFIAQAGVARLDYGTGFTGTDYFKGAYNARIAEAVDRAIERRSFDLRVEMEALKQTVEQVDTTIGLAETLIPSLKKTASVLVDVATTLAPLNATNVLKGCGLTQDLIELICRSAGGMLGLSMDLLCMLREAPAARRVVHCQLQTYHAALAALKDGHEKQLRDAAAYMRSRPDDIPEWKTEHPTAQLAEWLIQRGGK